MTIEFVFDQDCPNVPEARANLRTALEKLGLPLAWTEWDRSRSECPDRIRVFGSPSILVNGDDIAGLKAAPNSACCRVYNSNTGSSKGVPPVELIVSAIRPAQRPPSHRGLDGFTKVGAGAGIAGLGLSALASVSCAACIPALAGMLGAMGLGAAIGSRFLIPVSGLLLVLGLGSLAYRAKHRHGLRPFALGLTGSLLFLIGHFELGSELAMYAGAAVLVFATAWNARNPGGMKGCETPNADAHDPLMFPQRK